MERKDILKEFMVTIGTEVPVIVGQDQGLEPILIEDRIICYNCREYDHFVRDCANSREERDLEQLQQMLNLEAKEHSFAI